ncbi:RNA polymerase factor sigma-54 [Ferviditalea candida]|uniref:RNA polymerase factor sigma-54 n=1 Tax=Ferviditalea candida TaxID=3108399 RepID=A0ABU5ZHI7_9BACL|nr:RNA polymerase factor sigma-54 [Paenibacillaceae bacterium T2]
MNVEFRLDQLQSQKLLMTPELQQSIQVLQYSADELFSFLQEQANENPIIEIDWPFFDANRKRKTKGSNHNDENMDLIANLSGQADTLEERIMNQLRLIDYTPELFKAVSFFAGNLDDSGYLTISLSEAEQYLHLPAPTIERALHILQSFDPPGIGARDLRECLMLQIARDPNAPDMAEQIVQEHLDQLAKGKFDKIAKDTGISKEEVISILEYIRTLNPKPYASYGSVSEGPLIVDARIVLHPVSRQLLIITDKSLPKITVSMDLRSTCKSGDGDQFHDILQEKIKSANWLIRSIEHRSITLQKVIRAIVDEQYEFFTNESAGLKPLGLKVISEKLGLHESTISRAVRNKYIDTPKGIFELRFFFSNAISTSEGQQVSSRIVKTRIRELIEAEKRTKPLSDQKIADLLEKEGIPISRRTVAKYREEERILPSSLRKIQS